MSEGRIDNTTKERKKMDLVVSPSSSTNLRGLENVKSPQQRACKGKTSDSLPTLEKNASQECTKQKPSKENTRAVSVLEAVGFNDLKRKPEEAQRQNCGQCQGPRQRRGGCLELAHGRSTPRGHRVDDGCWIQAPRLYGVSRTDEMAQEVGVGRKVGNFLFVYRQGVPLRIAS